VPGLFFLAIAMLSGCTPVTYPESRTKQALEEILLKEYQIPHVDIQFIGTTLGVYLPLEELFAADFKEAIMSGKITNMESLFQPTEKAIDKVEDVLFSMSRVMLNTDKKIDFYFLQATDVEKTGMELTFIGQIDDVKRVRFWDIPRSEYRKRLIHDIRLNRAVLWHKPVRQFFKDLNEARPEIIQARYFPHTSQEKWAGEFFFQDSQGLGRWTILDIRSMPVQDNDIVVYVKAEVAPKDPKAVSFQPKTLEYLFQVTMKENEDKITRIIPFLHWDQTMAGAGISFTKDMIYESLPSWDSEFKAPDIQMGDFLARQLTRRLQEITAQDERIYNTFSGEKVLFKYDKKPAPYFSVNTMTPLRNPREIPYSTSQGIHEDILYLWELAAREFVEVLRSYSFQDYQGLKFLMTQNEGPLVWTASKQDLELFRRHKKKLKDILTLG